MAANRYSPSVGKKHLHREGSERFQYIPTEILGHATSWEQQGPCSTRWDSASILKTSGGRFVYTTESVSLWQGEGCSHKCVVFGSLEQLIEGLDGTLFCEELKDELVVSGLIKEDELFPEV